VWNRFQGSDFQTETVGNALEAECYSEASSAAFISLFPISITSLMYVSMVFTPKHQKPYKIATAVQVVLNAAEMRQSFWIAKIDRWQPLWT